MSHKTSNCLIVSLGIVVYVFVDSQGFMDMQSLKISMTGQNSNWMDFFFFYFLTKKTLLGKEKTNIF